MKKIIVFLAFVMVGLMAFAQNKKGVEIPYPNVPIDEQTNLVTYKEVVQQANATPQELFDRAMQWVKNYYKNTAEVITKRLNSASMTNFANILSVCLKMRSGQNFAWGTSEVRRSVMFRT